MLIYDCEIIKAIPPKNAIERLPDISYCGGWTDFENMGISVLAFEGVNGIEVCTSMLPDKLDFNPLHYHYPIHYGFDAFRDAVEESGFVGGFNSKNFDDNLCKANCIGVKTEYDLLEEVRLAAYGSISHLEMPAGYSYSLGKIAIANGEEKSLSGELAPIGWQKGLYEDVINYCVGDVKITSMLLDLGLAGELIDPNTGEFLRLRSIDEVIDGL